MKCFTGLIVMLFPLLGIAQESGISEAYTKFSIVLVFLVMFAMGVFGNRVWNILHGETNLNKQTLYQYWWVFLVVGFGIMLIGSFLSGQEGGLAGDFRLMTAFGVMCSAVGLVYGIQKLRGLPPWLDQEK